MFKTNQSRPDWLRAAVSEFRSYNLKASFPSAWESHQQLSSAAGQELITYPCFTEATDEQCTRARAHTRAHSVILLLLNEKWPFSVRRQRDFESESQSVTLGRPEGGVASSGSLCVSVLRWRWFQPAALSPRTLWCFPSVSAAAKSLQCPKTNTGEKRSSTHGANRWLMCLGQQIHQIRNTKYKSTEGQGEKHNIWQKAKVPAWI